MYLIVNDSHIGAKRSAGTTPKSALDLRAHLIEDFEWMIMNEDAHDSLIVLGDLFDMFQVSNQEVFQVLMILQKWLSTHTGELILVRGNHDYSTNTSHMSSLDLLGNFLASQSGRVKYITEPMVHDKFVIIPHLPNQDLFDHELQKWSEPDRTLLAHANYSNFFAEDKDHSLNISKAQAKGYYQVILAHEHNFRAIDNVTCLGNQTPSSIADCKDSPEKFLWLFDGEQLKCESAWTGSEYYVQVDWRDLEKISKTAYQFIRVNGEATTEEASDVISEINKFRKMSSAYVVSNAVIIDGVIQTDVELETLESLENLNILEMLYTKLSEPQVKRIKELLI